MKETSWQFNIHSKHLLLFVDADLAELFEQEEVTMVPCSPKRWKVRYMWRNEGSTVHDQKSSGFSTFSELTPLDCHFLNGLIIWFVENVYVLYCEMFEDVFFQDNYLILYPTRYGSKDLPDQRPQCGRNLRRPDPKGGGGNDTERVWNSAPFHVFSHHSTLFFTFDLAKNMMIGYDWKGGDTGYIAFVWGKTHLTCTYLWGSSSWRQQVVWEKHHQVVLAGNECLERKTSHFKIIYFFVTKALNVNMFKILCIPQIYIYIYTTVTTEVFVDDSTCLSCVYLKPSSQADITSWNVQQRVSVLQLRQKTGH